MVACAPNDGQTAVPFYAQRIPVQQRRARVSCGTLAVAAIAAGAPRIGVLPSFWWLASPRPEPSRSRCSSTGAAAPGGVVAVGTPPPPLAATACRASAACLHRTPSRVRLACHCRRPRRTVCRSRGSWMASRHLFAARRLDRRSRGRVVYLGAASSLWPRLPAGDEPHYLVIAQSLLRYHDLQIENNHTRGDYHEFFAPRSNPTTCAAASTARSTRFTRLVFPRWSLPSLRCSGIAARRTAGAALRGGDWTRMDRDLAPDRACGRELVRVGDGRPHRAVRVRDIHGVPRRPRRINRDGGCSRDAPGEPRRRSVSCCARARRSPCCRGCTPVLPCRPGRSG